MKATTHPKLVLDINSNLKELIVDICQLKNMSIKDYVLSALVPVLEKDSEELQEKIKLLEQLRS